MVEEECQLRTKDCLLPWKFALFDPAGDVSPCCAIPVSAEKFGNIHKAALADNPHRELEALFSREPYVDLRRSLLSGRLQAACVNCRVVADMVPIDEFGRKVRRYLQSRNRKVDASSDLSRMFAITDCMTNVTDRCNLSCIYCFIHSNDAMGDGMRGYLELDRQDFFKLIDSLTANGLEFLRFCATGELTVYPEWQTLLLEISQRHPPLKVTLVSNFARRFSDTDLVSSQS